MDDILPITPAPLPYELDDKIFYYTDEEGNKIGDPYSYNDHIAMLNSISGVNEELLGKRGE